MKDDSLHHGSLFHCSGFPSVCFFNTSCAFFIVLMNRQFQNSSYLRHISGLLTWLVVQFHTCFQSTHQLLLKPPQLTFHSLPGCYSSVSGSYALNIAFMLLLTVVFCSYELCASPVALLLLLMLSSACNLHPPAAITRFHHSPSSSPACPLLFPTPLSFLLHSSVQ